MDTPGFGMSDPPPTPDIEIPYYAAAALGVLDELTIERAHLVGLRTGASIAVELAANHAHRVDRVVVTGLLAMRSPHEREQWLASDLAERWEPDGRGEFLDRYVRDFVAMFATEDDGEGYLLELTAVLQAAGDRRSAYEAVVSLRGLRPAAGAGPADASS